MDHYKSIVASQAAKKLSTLSPKEPMTKRRRKVQETQKNFIVNVFSWRKTKQTFYPPAVLTITPKQKQIKKTLPITLEKSSHRNTKKKKYIYSHWDIFYYLDSTIIGNLQIMKFHFSESDLTSRYNQNLKVEKDTNLV